MTSPMLVLFFSFAGLQQFWMLIDIILIFYINLLFMVVKLLLNHLNILLAINFLKSLLKFITIG